MCMGHLVRQILLYLVIKNCKFNHSSMMKRRSSNPFKFPLIFVVKKKKKKLTFDKNVLNKETYFLK